MIKEINELKRKNLEKNFSGTRPGL
jgi:hypothetical protein